MFGIGTLPGELKLDGDRATVAGLSEVLRIWYSEAAGPTYIVNVKPVPMPEAFGSFMADAIRQVARAYAMQFDDATEEEALRLIWAQFDHERANPDAQPGTVIEPRR